MEGEFIPISRTALILTSGAMIQALTGSSATPILIVDNYGQKSHEALVERKTTAAQMIVLLTIEYNTLNCPRPRSQCRRLCPVGDRGSGPLIYHKFRMAGIFIYRARH